jgi:hypothetical protein
LHLIYLLSADTAKPSGSGSDLWLIFIAILLAAVLFSYSSRINNLDKMIKMLNEKINNLEGLASKLQTAIKNKSSMRDINSRGILDDNVIVNGPFNEENVENPEELIDNTPKISSLFDPRIKRKIHHSKDIDKSDTE